MEIVLFILIAITLVAGVYAIVIYNGLVSLKHAYKKAWANIDVLLKQRHDEIPKLVSVVQEYAKYEQETLDKVMQARASIYSARENGDVAGVGAGESMLRMGLGNLFAVAENYPELKANESFQHLQHRISGLENSIADRREYYNEAVNNNNIRIEQFPDVIIARFFNFNSAELLEFSEEEIKDVDVKALFNS
ncbi:MAG: LemA family protein [Sedimenticola sp.]